MPPLPRVLPLAVVAALLALVPAVARADRATPRVVGGSVAAITDAPWQVYLVIGGVEACGGSLLDATHVLTAAHCLDQDGKAPLAAASAIDVLAGVSDVSTWTPGGAAPAGGQAAKVASLRVHPFYDNQSKTDDVAVLTLASALNLAGPNVKAIALAAPGTPLPGGTPVRVTGYGRSSPTVAQPDGKLRAANLTVVGDDDCRNDLSGTSAVILCTTAPGTTTCFGDSGGPLTTGSPAVQVGVVDYGDVAGCGTGNSMFADVTAPEVRAFIDGAADVPRAPRQSTPAVLSAVTVPVVGSPFTCQPGTWDGAPTFTYTFQVDGVGPLQSGPSPVFTPTSAVLGKPVTCVVQAANAGGTSTARTGTAPPLAADRIPPSSRITSLSCTRRRTCRLRVQAGDSNSLGQLLVTGTATYRRGHKTSRRKLKIRSTSPGHYAITITKLPRGRTITFSVRAYDAVGNRQRFAARRTKRFN